MNIENNIYDKEVEDDTTRRSRGVVAIEQEERRTYNLKEWYLYTAWLQKKRETILNARCVQL